MKVLTILSRKGGTGKTTLAVNLAVAAQRAKTDTLILDLDIQTSATSWKDIRGDELPAVAAIPYNRLTPELDKARKAGAGLVILDTPPHTDAMAAPAARAANFILIPCRPSIFDLRAIQDTLEIVTFAKRAGQYAVVLTATPAQGQTAVQAHELLAAQEITVAPQEITQRAAFYHSTPQGKGVLEYDPESRAAEEITSLYRWVSKQLDAN